MWGGSLFLRLLFGLCLVLCKCVLIFIEENLLLVEDKDVWRGCFFLRGGNDVFWLFVFIFCINKCWLFKGNFVWIVFLYDLFINLVFDCVCFIEWFDLIVFFDFIFLKGFFLVLFFLGIFFVEYIIVILLLFWMCFLEFLEIKIIEFFFCLYFVFFGFIFLLKFLLFILLVCFLWEGNVIVLLVFVWCERLLI